MARAAGRKAGEPRKIPGENKPPAVPSKRRPQGWVRVLRNVTAPDLTPTAEERARYAAIEDWILKSGQTDALVGAITDD